MHLLTKLFASLLLAAGTSSALAAPIVFSVGGNATAASIQTVVDAFRGALGDPNNANNPGPLASGRREINWDGGGVDTTAPLPPANPFDVFLQTRGSRYTTPGQGLTQGPPSGGPQGGLATLFNNPTYGTTFGVFSVPRLFVPVGSNVTDGVFFIPGTNGGTTATVSGFGAVFTDVDLPTSTQISFFDAGGSLLYSSFVLPGTVPNASLSFLGVFFDAGERISRVRITTGTGALGPNDNPSAGVDMVAMDDFFYGEPQAIALAEPPLLALLALAAIGLIVRRKR